MAKDNVSKLFENTSRRWKHVGESTYRRNEVGRGTRMSWSAEKSTAARQKWHTQAIQLVISCQQIIKCGQTKSLGVAATASGTTTKAKMRQIEKVITVAMVEENADIHIKGVTMATFIRISEAFLLPRVLNGVYLRFLPKSSTSKMKHTGEPVHYKHDGLL